MSDYNLVDVLFDILSSHQISLESRKVPPVACFAKPPLLNGHPQTRRQLHLLLALKRRRRFSSFEQAQPRMQAGSSFPAPISFYHGSEVRMADLQQSQEK